MQNTYAPEGALSHTPENAELISTLPGLEYAMNNGLTLEARAELCDSSRNLCVNLGDGIRGIIPKEEVSFNPDGRQQKDIAVITRVGKPVCFKVRSVDKSGACPVALLSRKAAQLECYENHISLLSPGDITDAKITHMEPFGAFCDIGAGLIALLSVDCISVSRISHPSQRFSNGELIKCAVKQNDSQSGRITLTMKELLGTWEQNACRFKAGETAAGIVRSVEPYGIFVELAPNLAGLAEWCPDVRAGQSAAVYIKSIIPEKMKIKLVIVDVSDQAFRSKPVEYFFDGTHMDSWLYSPEESAKRIYTDFSESAEQPLYF